MKYFLLLILCFSIVHASFTSDLSHIIQRHHIRFEVPPIGRSLYGRTLPKPSIMPMQSSIFAPLSEQYPTIQTICIESKVPLQCWATYPPHPATDCTEFLASTRQAQWVREGTVPLQFAEAKYVVSFVEHDTTVFDNQ